MGEAFAVVHAGSSLAIQWLSLRFHCRGHGFSPWSGNSDPTCCKVYPHFF